MNSNGSVSHWIAELKEGDSMAARRIWERYFGMLVRLARKKLADVSRRAFDEEDMALSALDSFCRRLERGQYPNLRNRDDLWNLLMVITVHKCWNQIKHERREKRGGGRIHGESSLLDFQPDGDQGPLARVLGDEPSPELAVTLAEEFQELLAKLDDDQLRAIALAKMEGYTDEEVAARQGCTRRTIVRKLKLIRAIWASSAAAAAN